MRWETIKKIARNGYVIAGGIITLIGSIATVYGVAHPSGTEHNSNFLGRWESKYQYPVPGGTVAFNGITEYFRNGRYNVRGTLKISSDASDKPYSAVLISKGSGIWMADDQFLTLTLTGLHTEPASFIIGEQSGYSLPDMNKRYVPGSSDEYQILSQERQKIVLQGKDPFGNPFKIVSSKTR
ncbi:hypothetical protein F0170_20960 [Pseudomonas sp. MAFF 730085]|uniref:Uncharacterized protein n=1 Tax=Pseudomonas kitaguniensis TaxID=2607908 RepID=A0A5N7JY46_9PSED|nr:hypothetical protein [Pseudomonas kitaguniensis]MPQ86236.1 hypothetical protein [Pseudomonas kitaguniensis]